MTKYDNQAHKDIKLSKLRGERQRSKRQRKKKRDMTVKKEEREKEERNSNTTAKKLLGQSREMLPVC